MPMELKLIVRRAVMRWKGKQVAARKAGNMIATWIKNAVTRRVSQTAFPWMDVFVLRVFCLVFFVCPVGLIIDSR